MQLVRLVTCSAVTVACAAAVPTWARDPGPVRSIAILSDALGSSGLPDLNGRVWRAEGLEGRVVLIDVWATWCAPCLADLPALRTLATGRAPELVVLGVSLDTMPRRDFVSWLSRHEVTWPQHFDGRGYRGAVADRLGVTSLPASLLFDSDGRLIARNLRAREVDMGWSAGRLVRGPRPQPARAPHQP